MASPTLIFTLTSPLKRTYNRVVSNTTRAAAAGTTEIFRRRIALLISIGSIPGAPLIETNKGSNFFLSQLAVAVEPNSLNSTTSDFPKRLDSTIRARISRPAKSRSREDKEKYEEVLVVDIELDKESRYVKFDVFVNDEDGDEEQSRADSAECAGSFVSLGRRVGSGMATRRCLRLGLTDLLEELGADGEESLLVGIVPRTGCDGVVIGGVRVELLGD